MSNELEEWLEEFELTDELNEPIFILKDGRMIFGDFDMGVRGLDHNCIISLAPDDYSHVNKWNYIHSEFSVVRVIPETVTAFIKKGQVLTDSQKDILEDSGYEIEEY